MSTESGGSSRAGANGANGPGDPPGPEDDSRTQPLPLSSIESLSHTSNPDPDYYAGSAAGYAGAAFPDRVNREALLAQEKERFGGMKFGAAFFGWLTATALVVLLSALAAAVGAAFGFSTGNDLGEFLAQAAASQSAGVTGAVILLGILLLAYFSGGYVAGRMARFSGLKQGLAVWLWTVAAGLIVVVLGLIFGADLQSGTELNLLTPLPEGLGGTTAAVWIAVGATLAVILIGALLGGLAGMRYHRRIDRADYSSAAVRS